jgi:hypothetical protein
MRKVSFALLAACLKSVAGLSNIRRAFAASFTAVWPCSTSAATVVAVE